MLGWFCCAPVASRVSPRRASYFFLLRQKKVTKKKASHVRAASRSLALLAAFGTLANSLRSNSASVLIRTLLRCSARPNGGGYLTARPLRGPRPGCSFAALTSRGFGVASFLKPHFSPGHGTPCHYTRPPSLLTPHSYDLTPTTSLLTPHSSLLTPHSSLLTPHPSLLTPHSSLLSVRGWVHLAWLESAASGRCYCLCGNPDIVQSILLFLNFFTGYQYETPSFY